MGKGTTAMHSIRSSGRALVLAAAALAAPLGCLASDGTITINGSVTAETCSIASTVGTTAGTNNFTITLPNVSSATLSAAGKTSGTTRFSLLLSGCNAMSGAGTVYAFFEHGTTVNSAGRLSNTAATTPATGVDIELLNATGTSMNLASTAGSQGATPVPVTSNTATLTYYARYYATAAAGAGNLATSVTYSIVYP